jgi:hypothetical protein
MTITKALDFNRVWRSATPYADFIGKVARNRSLWEGVYRTTPIPDGAVERARESGIGLRLLAIVEDWCGDGSNALPVIAKLAHLAGCLELRVIEREDNLDVMDRYLTNGARSIPIVIVLDSDYQELCHWGPRPAELQSWVMSNKDSMPKDERFRQVRRWYARDKGASILAEMLDLIERSRAGQ